MKKYTEATNSKPQIGGGVVVLRSRVLLNTTDLDSKEFVQESRHGSSYFAINMPSHLNKEYGKSDAEHGQSP